MALANERFTEGEGPRRIADRTQSGYQTWLRECWSEEFQRELTPAEIAARKHGQNLGPSAHPVHNDGDVDNHNFRISGTRYRTKAEVEAEERQQRGSAQKAAQDQQRRKEIAARQAAFLLEDDLQRDLYDRIGLP